MNIFHDFPAVIREEIPAAFFDIHAAEFFMGYELYILLRIHIHIIDAEIISRKGFRYT